MQQRVATLVGEHCRCTWYTVDPTQVLELSQRCSLVAHLELQDGAIITFRPPEPTQVPYESLSVTVSGDVQGGETGREYKENLLLEGTEVRPALACPCPQSCI